MPIATKRSSHPNRPAILVLVHDLRPVRDTATENVVIITASKAGPRLVSFSMGGGPKWSIFNAYSK